MSSAVWLSKIVALTLTLKPAAWAALIALHRDLEHALLRHRAVVLVLQAVEMNGDDEIGRGLEQVQLLLEQQRVGAQRHELLARDDARDDFADLLVNERLAAGDGDDRRAAFVDRV